MQSVVLEQRICLGWHSPWEKGLHREYAPLKSHLSPLWPEFHPWSLHLDSWFIMPSYTVGSFIWISVLILWTHDINLYVISICLNHLVSGRGKKSCCLFRLFHKGCSNPKSQTVERTKQTSYLNYSKTIPWFARFKCLLKTGVENLPIRKRDFL